MNYTKMYEAIRGILSKDEQIDFVMTNRTARMIEVWGNVYAGRSPWLSETVQSAGIAAAVCGEHARLIMLEAQAAADGSVRAEYVNGILQKVITQLQIQQAELGLAKGGLIIKPYISGGKIAVQYLQADMFFPIEYDTDKIIRCAFLDQYRNGDTIYSRVELHSLKGSTLEIKNRAFMSRNDESLGSEVSLQEVSRWADMAEITTFQNVESLPFGYFVVPLANNIEPESKMGISAFSRAMGQIAEADKRYSQINWEYESKETAIHVAQSLLHRTESGNFEYPAGKDRLYRELDYNMGPNDKALLEDFSPAIRDQSYLNGWNELMRMIEFRCYLAYGTLSNPNQVEKTAEEIRASKQRSYSFVKHCQSAIQTALEDFVKAVLFWCDVYSLEPAGDVELAFCWDDSIVVDTESERKTDRADVAMGAMQLWEYRMKWYGEDEQTAKAAIVMEPNVIEW